MPHFLFANKTKKLHIAEVYPGGLLFRTSGLKELNSLKLITADGKTSCLLSHQDFPVNIFFHRWFDSQYT
jgi:hypothetical protein